MLIPLDQLVSKYHLNLTGVLHIGGHECEERGAYHQAGVSDANIVWLEGNPHLVSRQMKLDPNVKIFQALVTDTDDCLQDLMVTNNGQSSSILEFGTHSTDYPHIVETERMPLQTVTVDTFLLRHPELASIPINFINIDIQGAELKALRGASHLLPQCQALYLEVNTQEVYRGCALLPELDTFLKEYGFHRKELCMTGQGWGDALYLRE
jgi:FkbM family methyltransferase